MINNKDVGKANDDKAIQLEELVFWVINCGLSTGHADTTQDLLNEIKIQITEMRNKLNQISIWVEAYPLSVFPEPDWDKAKKILKDNGMISDSISASNIRDVLTGIKEIINA